MDEKDQKKLKKMLETAFSYLLKKNKTWGNEWKEEDVSWLIKQAKKCVERVAVCHAQSLSEKLVEKAVDGLNYLLFVIARTTDDLSLLLKKMG